MPIRKRKPVELRPSESNSMKRRHPEFGYHKNYIHPWSLFQKGCALQYRQLTNRQKQQLLLKGKIPLQLNLMPKETKTKTKTKSPLPTTSFQSINSPATAASHLSINPSTAASHLSINSPVITQSLKNYNLQLNELTNKIASLGYSHPKKIAIAMQKHKRKITNYTKQSQKKKKKKKLKKK